MKIQNLKARLRQTRGKGGARQTRRDGMTPAVLCGGAGDPISLSIEVRAFENLIHGEGGEHAIVKIDVEDKPDLSSPALLKEVQHHPVRGHVLHADFTRIDLNKPIQTLRPIHLTGQAPGIVDGGILDHTLREIEIECLPADTPDFITVDISSLGMGHILHVSDLTPPEKVTFITEPDRAVVGVLTPRALVTTTTAAEEGAEAPAEGEGEAAAEKKKEGEKASS